MTSIHRSRALHRCLVLVACIGLDAAAQTPVTPDGPPAAKPARARHATPRPTSGAPAALRDSDGDGSHEHGDASYYAHHLTGRRTASGQAYDPNALTAAHRTLPLGTQVKVVNPKNDRSVVVTVNDRGPVPKNRMIDVSSAAAEQLDMKKSGVTKVETQVVGKSDLPKTDGAAAKGDGVGR